MIIIFIGKQGSGKGTQAKLIAKKIGLCHISTGDLLRNTSGKLKQKVDSYISQGKLVPSEIVIQLLQKRMKKPDCRNGIILDGFPRNIKQAQNLDKILKADKIIEIFISDNTSIKRLSGRWNCKCGAAYNYETEPKPKVKGICDKCGGKLFQREDDKPKTIRKRLEIYKKETKPILKYYKNKGRKVIRVNGEDNIEQVKQNILKIIK